MIKKILAPYLFIFVFENIQAQIVYSDSSSNLIVDRELYYLEDKEDNKSFKTISQSNNFALSNKSVQNFGITSSAIWFRLTIKNKTGIENLILQVNQPIIDQIDFYCFNKKLNRVDSFNFGEYKNFNQRIYKMPEYLFDLNIPKDSTILVYFKVKCKENMQVPIEIGTRISVLNKSVKSNIASGIYFGIMIVMILYNLFIYATLRDKSYIIYSIYIVFILITQTSLQGLTFQLLWPNSPWLATYSPFLFPTLVGVVALEFFKYFLKIQERNPFAYKISFVFLLPYFTSIILGFLGFFKVSFMMVEATAGCVSIYMLIVAYLIYRQGFSEARFFLVGWSIFLVGIYIYVMKDFEVLPYNNFTRYTMHFGSAFEVVLLSFALADRINIFKKEKELSQAEALRISEENQKLIKDQNIILELKVHERTLELEETNDELNSTLNHLKDTQTQLVNAEKMASLGQLTAGIAHEINNPINFVSSNLKPLKLDIEEVMQVVKKYEEINPKLEIESQLKEIEKLKEKLDLNFLKQEITSLLNGIEDGAKRTAEIVSGLRNFSRVDETQISLSNINEGIESTLVIVRSSIPENVTVITEFSEIPIVECFAGKINQVFMNVLTNGIYAIRQKNSTEPQTLTIKTYLENDLVCASFTDTGIGMSQDVKEKIYEPFFTTKTVGDGTGLGMSIVFKIIESHHANLNIESEVGKGTTITLKLNQKLKIGS